MTNKISYDLINGIEAIPIRLLKNPLAIFSKHLSSWYNSRIYIDLFYLSVDEIY
ncbi:MAG: hypothetical protein F6K23_08485 [Okeania sp. SIO2C9]|uniref:hypothetical protein n=1 Tax=Okeania sp. SIO2C9 TaxID=2607791 RepID=UPI0013C1AD60|nr:hypothetical protein [Okeania sp. SIO2C9]NEQ73111.1 hypothetical protein [Okeania sp. SIO2C9]